MYNLRERKKSCPKNLATTPSPPPLQRTKGLSLKLSDVVKVHLIMTFVDMVHNFRIVIRHQDSLFLLLLGHFESVSFHFINSILLLHSVLPLLQTRMVSIKSIFFWSRKLS